MIVSKFGIGSFELEVGSFAKASEKECKASLVVSALRCCGAHRGQISVGSVAFDFVLGSFMTWAG